MSERRRIGGGFHRRSSVRSAVAAIERAAIDRHRRGSPRVEGRRLTVVADVRDETELRAAVAAGADAVRLRLGAGAPWDGDVARLAALVGHCRTHGSRLWCRVAGVVPQRVFQAASAALWTARRAGVAAVEIEDPGLLRLARDLLPDLALHAGPALGARSAAAVDLLEKAGVTRVVLPPEVTLGEVRDLATSTAVELEVSLHGPVCFATADRCSLDRGEAMRPCDGPCRAAIDAVSLGEAGVGRRPRLGFRLAPALQAAGVAAVRVAATDTVSVAAAVRALRLAIDAGPLPGDATLAVAEEWVDGRQEAPPPPALSEGPAGLRVHMTIEAGPETVLVTVRDARRPLAEARWPATPESLSVDDLEAALRPPQERAIRIETLTLRGAAVGAVPDLGARAAHLWDDVVAALEVERTEILRVRTGAPGPGEPAAGARPLVTLAFTDLDAAIAALVGDSADRVEVALSALESAPGGTGALGRLGAVRRARLHVGLPRATFEDDGARLGRRLRRLADAGLGGVVAHDLGQLAAARAAGLGVTAGAGLAPANVEAIVFFELLGCQAAELSADLPLDDWRALLAVRWSLPLRAPIRGWFPRAVSRLPVPTAPEDGWKGPDGQALRVWEENGLTLVAPAAPFDRVAAQQELAGLGLREILLDGRGAAGQDERGSAAALLADAGVRKRSAGGDGGLASEDDHAVELRLGRLYGTADRLTRAFREKHRLACSSACARCCAQLVPVWPIEAAALIPGVRALLSTDEQRQALRERAATQMEEQAAVFRRAGFHQHASEMPIWRVRPGELEPLVGRRWSACVLLQDGRCTVYERRPLLCRVYGFPTAAIPGNLCRRLSGPLLEAATNGRLPSIPAAHVGRLGEAIRRIQGLPDGVTDMTTIAAIITHALR